MLKKLLALTAVTALAVFAVPASASAVTYVPGGGVTVTVSGTPSPGATVTVTAQPGSFPTDTGAVITFDGAKDVVGTAEATTMTVTEAGSATFVVKLPAATSGTQAATITGAQTGRFGSAVITVVAADSAAGSTQLASAGYQAPVALIAGGSAALLIGLLLTLASILKRRRATV
jgi:hypothetical protein